MDDRERGAMQVTEVAADGLRRHYRVVVPAEEIESRVTSRLQGLAKRVRVPGFRPGKAPLGLLKAQYGKSVMGEVLEQAVDEGAKKAISDHELKPALRPKIEVTSFDEGKSLEFDVQLEVLPEVPQVDTTAIALTRLVCAVDEARVADALDRLAKARQQYRAPEPARPAREGDRVALDFEGSVDGQPFEGGKGTDVPLTLGGRTMIPGFEEQIAGMAAGESRTIEVTFPADFPNDQLKGKAASFAVTVKKVEEPVPVTVDDAFAKEVGVDDLAALQRTMRERIEQEYRGVARGRMKRQLLDHLAEAYPFEVPPGMVEMEFEAIWKQLQREMEQQGQSFASLGESEEASRAEYRAIADRRVRLGLILSDIGTRNGIKVEAQELQQAVMREAMRFPGQEKKVFDFYQSNPGALEQLRAPIFEDKVVDFIFSLAKVEERAVPVEELMADPDEAPPAADGATKSA
jgi:trigger factor